MSQLNIVQAINMALRQEMEKDERVVVLGEDVGRDGGVFRVTEGLLEKFGEKRVVDTPLSELGIVGIAIGMAIYGLRPVVEIQFDGFMYPILDQLISHAGRLRTRSRGRFHVPIVVRAPFGGGIRAPEHHSESPETHFVHTPGLKVVVPSNPYDAKGLLISAMRDQDPVVFLEPKKIYRAIRAEVPDEEYTVPLGTAFTLTEGKDVSVFIWGAMTHVAVEAARKAKEKGFTLEVVDLRTLSPIDTDAIVASVRKTGRAIIVHEAPRTGGLGAEVAAIISEKALLHLKAPIIRVTGFDTPFPLYKLEDRYMPTVDRILKACEKVVNF
ncbi:MAG: alpha-ketoacid dehydrogenase subunit beta [archaeon]